MADQNKEKLSSQAMWIVPLVVLAIIIGLALVWRLWHAPKQVVTKPKPEQTTAMPQKPPIIESNERASEPVIKAQITIDDVIKVRQHWNPAFIQLVGRQAPDFDVADINGKTQKLSGYKGKTVMLVFWATWCPPCRMEIPGLIELRNKISPDNLAIIAVSYENADNIRVFASKTGINYIVIATLQGAMPAPFAMIDAIPTTFFIDKDNVIRLVAEGLVLPKEIEMILKAIS